MADADAGNAGGSASEGAGGENDVQDPLSAAAKVGGGDGGDLAAGGDEAAVIPDKFKNDDGTLNGDAMVKSYTELEGRVGSIGMPPKDVSEYDIKYDNLPEGTEINEETQAEFLKGCLEHGMTNKQAQFVLDKHIEAVGASVTDRVAAKKDCIEVLTNEWGNDYNANVDIALKAYNRLASETDIKDPKAMESVGNNPVMLRILANIGKNLKEDNDPGNNTPTMDSKEDIDALMKSEAYQSRKHPEHAKVLARVTKYFELKNPKKAG